MIFEFELMVGFERLRKTLDRIAADLFDRTAGAADGVMVMRGFARDVGRLALIVDPRAALTLGRKEPKGSIDGGERDLRPRPLQSRKNVRRRKIAALALEDMHDLFPGPGGIFVPHDALICEPLPESFSIPRNALNRVKPQSV